MFIRARSFFLSALVGAACLTASGCAEDPIADDPSADDPMAETDPSVPAGQASPREPAQPLPLPVDPPRDGLTPPATIAAPTIVVDVVEPGPSRRIGPLPRLAIGGAMGEPVIVPDDDEAEAAGASRAL